MKRILLLCSALGVSSFLGLAALDDDFIVIMDTPPELSLRLPEPNELVAFENSLQFVDSHLFEWTAVIPYHFSERINQAFENRRNVKTYRNDQLIFYYQYRFRADIA